ncbi:MAG TPA: hypothetical protein VGK40_06155 [Verrucomicrobiae bacterium]
MQMALAPPVSSAAPANDHCIGAEVIPGAGPFPYWTSTNDIAEATSTEDAPYYPSCAQFGGLGRTVWFSFTPSVSAKYMFTTCSEDGTATTVYDPFIAVYSATSCAGPFTVVTFPGGVFCNDDACGFDNLQSRVLGPLVGGIAYYIVVWSYDSPPEHPGTALQVRIDRFLPPPNDTCASATPLTLNIPASGTTVGAFNDYELSGTNCFTGISQSPSPASGRDVVYSFTAPSAGDYSFKVYDYLDSGRYLVIYIADSCPVGPPPAIVTTCLAAANRSSASKAEEIPCYSMSAGQQVYLIVDENVGSEGSAFTVEVTSCIHETEPNDDFVTANIFNPILGIEGSIASGMNPDLDYYSLGAHPPGSRVFALVDGVAASNQGHGQNFDLRVITGTDLLEFDNDANSPQFGNGAPNIAGTVLNGAPTCLVVDNVFSASEPYRLYAVVQDVPPTPEGTNRHDTITAPKTAKSDYFTGTVTNGELDVYGFTASAGDLIFLSLDGDPLRDNTPINAQLELLDTCGDVLVLVDNPRNDSNTNLVCSDLECPDYPGEGLVYRARHPGNYYARVSISPFASLAASSGDYILSITKNCQVVQERVLYFPPILSSLSVASAVLEGRPTSVSGIVSDPNTNGPRTVLIGWGDGAADAVSLSAGVSTFNVSHLYGPNTPRGTATNTYSVTIAVSGSFSCITTGTNISVITTVLTSITPLPGGHLQLRLQGLPGVIYRIEATNSLGANPWTTVGTVTNDSSGMALWEDIAPDPQRSFYRAVSP